MQPLRCWFKRTPVLLALASLAGCVTLPGRETTSTSAADPQTIVEEEPRSSWENDPEEHKPSPLTKHPPAFVTPEQDRETYLLVTRADKAKAKSEESQSGHDYLEMPSEEPVLPPPLHRSEKPIRTSECAPMPTHLEELPEPPEIPPMFTAEKRFPEATPLEAEVPDKAPLPILEDSSVLADLHVQRVGGTMDLPAGSNEVRQAFDAQEASLSPSQREQLREKAKSLELAIQQRDRLLQQATSEIREATSEVRQARQEMREWTEDIKGIEERIKQREQEYLKTLRSMIEPLQDVTEQKEAKVESRWKKRGS